MRESYLAVYEAPEGEDPYPFKDQQVVMALSYVRYLEGHRLVATISKEGPGPPKVAKILLLVPDNRLRNLSRDEVERWTNERLDNVQKDRSDSAG